MDTISVERQSKAFIDPDLAFKLIVVGDAGVGKTCLIRRFAYDEFEEDHTVTIGGDFINVSYLIDKSTRVKLQIWDTCGLEQYRSLVRLYFKGAHAALIAYNLTEKSINGIKDWHKEVKENTSTGTPTYLVGTKSDLGVKAIPEEEINNLVKELGIAGGFETSAKTKEGIEEMCKELLMNLYKTAKEEKKEEKKMEGRIKVESIRRRGGGKKKKCC